MEKDVNVVGESVHGPGLVVWKQGFQESSYEPSTAASTNDAN